VEPEVIATATPPASDVSRWAARGHQRPAVEDRALVGERLGSQRPLGQHLVSRDHGVGLDVLERERELLGDGVAAEHRHHAATQTDGERGRERAPRVVGLHQHGRRAAERVLQRRRQVTGRLHHLSDGVLTERVDDGELAGRAVGAGGEVPCKLLHLWSSWVQCR
jgi:hypothetical protein